MVGNWALGQGPCAPALPPPDRFPDRRPPARGAQAPGGPDVFVFQEDTMYLYFQEDTMYLYFQEDTMYFRSRNTRCIIYIYIIYVNIFIICYFSLLYFIIFVICKSPKFI